MHPFENALSIPLEATEIGLRGFLPAPLAEFWLNPRRLRGSDFLMRWSQGVWSEERLVQAVAGTDRYFALPYGPSSTAPDDDVRAFELYFERLETAGLGQLKRPDLLILPKSDGEEIERTVLGLGGVQELPFTPEDQPGMQRLLEKAVVGVECENSLWVAKRMPDFGAQMKPQKRLGGRVGLKKNAILPTVIIKEEDRPVLRKWQEQTGVKIHVWQVFYDVSFGLSLGRAEQLIADGTIEPTAQVYYAPGGPTTRKLIYKFYYHYAYQVGEMQSEPELVADQVTDKNGHVLPYVRFQGGELRLSGEALTVLDEEAAK